MTAAQRTSRLVDLGCTDAVAVLELTDPARSNALTPEMVEELRTEVAALGSRDVAAVVVCAAGANFCAGGDHESLVGLAIDERRAYLAATKSLLTELRDTSSVTVACVQGGAIGGGVELALHCDLVVAADTAWFSVPHVALGTRLARSSYTALTSRTGIGFARRLVLLGDVIGAQAAQTAGLVDVVTRTRDLRAAATTLAEDLAALPKDSLDHARRMLAGG